MKTPGPAMHAYCGYRKCGHLYYLAVDDASASEEGRMELAREVAQVIRAGGHITRVTIEEARTLTLGCPEGGCKEP